MDRVLEVRVAAARTRVEQLTDQEQRLLAQLQEVRAGLARAQQEVDGVVAAAKREASSSRRVVAEEAWRRTVRTLGTFTASELAAELGCSPITVKKHLCTMMESDPPMVRPAGKLGKAPMYSYIKPEDEGTAFSAQRRHGLHATEPIIGTQRTYAGPITGTGRHPADVIASAAVRKVVKDAIRDGWQLVPKGDGHYNLVKNGAKVGVAGTPKNPTGAAAVIARQLRNAERVAA